MTQFADFPDFGNGIRLVGTTLMDEEQWTVEEWADHNGELRPTLAGLQRWGRLKAERKEERRSAWKTRQDRDAEYSEQMTALIEEGTEG